MIIPPPKNAVIRPQSARDPTVRDRHIAQIRSNGRMAWQAATGYNQRSRIETQIGRWKSVIGPRLRSRSFSRQITEIQVGQKVLNTMTALGRPVFERYRLTLPLGKGRIPSPPRSMQQRFSEYVNRRRKHPFEVEYIWADKYERHTEEFDNPYDFAVNRDGFGDLLLLPKDFNASFGAAEYEEKLPDYFGQNLLAASLNESAYKNNPSFGRFIERTVLPFKSYPEGFTKSDIEERQDLYRQICEYVWSPNRLGLGGGTSSETATREASSRG